MRKSSFLFVLATSVVLSLSSCVNVHDSSSNDSDDISSSIIPSSDSETSAGGDNTSSVVPSSDSSSEDSDTSKGDDGSSSIPSSSDGSSTSEAETLTTYSVSFGDLTPNNPSTTPNSSSYSADGINIKSIDFTACFGMSRNDTSANSYGIKMGSGSKKGSFTINFGTSYIIKQADIYAARYDGDTGVEYKCVTSANTNGMAIVIDSEESTKYSYLYLDNETGTASNSLTFGANAKGRIFVYKIDLLVSSGGSSSGGSSSSSSEDKGSSSEDSSGSGSDSSSSSEDTTPNIEPSGYYEGINWNTSGATLKTALYSVISKGTKNIGYDGLYTAYEKTDLRDDGYIWDMYSNENFNPKTDRAGNYKAEGDCYNREHTIPQSSWKSTGGASSMRSDIFHVIPTDGYVNNRRSSYPHGNVLNATYTSKNGSKLGTGNNNGYSGIVFEVIDEYKGDFARAYFYFVTRYQNYIPSVNYAAFAKNTYPSLSSWALKTYLEWNDLDPVSEKERKRNDAAYTFQNNRNPFIDHPEAVDKIWGSYR